MAGVRIRWRGVARAAAIVVIGLIALRLLPGFLRAPEPPPLAADVGLPRAKPLVTEPALTVARPATKASRTPPAKAPRRRRKARQEKPGPRLKKPAAGDAPASTAVIGSRHRRSSRAHRRRRHRHREQSAPQTSPPSETPPAPVESPAPQAAEYVPPAPPEPSPAPLSEPSSSSPSTPADGSQEFAPH